MRYERRPERPVHYVGVVRGVPAVEQRVLRTYFGRQKRLAYMDKLSPEHVRRLAHIMARPYSEAAVLASSRYSVRQCTGSATYSSFNMGTGEDVLVTLFRLLENAPVGSLIVIEEIEIGLHPEAVARLAHHLQEIVMEKKLQVITSTHSEHFLDAVPREARILLERTGSEHHTVPGPPTRLALGVMLGEPRPELSVYCEDSFAGLLIRTALPSELRRRVQIVPVGSKAELAKLAAFHVRSGLQGNVVIVWDGDVSDEEIARWVQEAERTAQGWADRVHVEKLPTHGSPESWVIETVRSEVGQARLLSKFPGENVAEIANRLFTCTDPKDAWHEISRYLGLPEHSVRERAVEAACEAAESVFGPLRQTVARALDAHSMPKERSSDRSGAPERQTPASVASG